MTARQQSFLAIGALAFGLIAWLWPLGVGGAMPVGGDVTGFSLGLMGFLHESYQDLRLPIWNDLWGHGFPGLAESQMGAYYPPHILLYGFLRPEYAYTASLVSHTIWGGLGAYWAGRKFGAGPASAALGGFAWAASGFFVIHLPHQWGYTVGSWMPWALGLAWSLVAGQGGGQRACGLAAVLAIQVLPGHFQLAFITQAACLMLVVWGLVERPDGARRAFHQTWRLAAAIAAVVPLAAMQLLPTHELAGQVGSRRDFDYLSGFASSPFHLISYIAPGLFHVSPLWRPLAWDPFHTSPEEHLAYIGLIPFFLAFLALKRFWRRDPAIRALAWVAFGTLLLSLGPYAPGFRWLIRLPGFSFFRAPARWGLATELALALLAARGFDGLLAQRPSRRALRRFALAVVLPLGAALGTIEMALMTADRPGSWGIAPALEAARSTLPWRDGPSVKAILEHAKAPPDNPLVIDALRRRGEDPRQARFDRDRSRIYIREIAPTLVLLGLMLATGLALRRPAWLAGGFVALTLLDLLVLGTMLRPVETAPLRPLLEQSPVLARLAASPRGERVLSPLANLPMLVGAATLRPYRTLDRPIQVPGDWRLGDIIIEPSSRFDPAVAEAVATAFRFESIADPSLSAWTNGAPSRRAKASEMPRFTLGRRVTPSARAWLHFGKPQRDPSAWIDSGTPLAWRTNRPEHFECDVTAPPRDANGASGYVLVSILDDPEWSGVWYGESGPRAAVIEHVAFDDRVEAGGWMAVRVPEPGRWTLRLTYQGRAARWGLMISAVAWAAWLVLFWRARRTPNIEMRERTRA